MAEIGDKRREMKEAYERLGNWRDVAEEFDVDPSLAWQVVTQGYEPKKAKNRVKLELPIMVPVPVCRVCGVVHVSKSCPTKRAARRRDLWDFPVGELRRMLEDALELLNIERRRMR